MRRSPATPSPRRGEGWGEGERAQRAADDGDYSPAPNPLTQPSPRRGEGFSLPIRATHARTGEQLLARPNLDLSPTNPILRLP